MFDINFNWEISINYVRIKLSISVEYNPFRTRYSNVSNLFIFKSLPRRSYSFFRKGTIYFSLNVHTNYSNYAQVFSTIRSIGTSNYIIRFSCCLFIQDNSVRLRLKWITNSLFLHLLFKRLSQLCAHNASIYQPLLIILDYLSTWERCQRYSFYLVSYHDQFIIV